MSSLHDIINKTKRRHTIRIMEKIDIPGYQVIDTIEEDTVYRITVSVASIVVPKSCIKCHHTDLIKSGTSNITIADLPKHGKSVKLIIKRRRYRCKSCKTSMSEVLPNIDENHRMTNRLMTFINERISIDTPSQIARTVHLNETTIRNIIKESLIDTKPKILFKIPKTIGIHEISIHNGYYYIVTNIETQTIINVLPNDMKILRTYLESFPKAADRKVFYEMSPKTMPYMPLMKRKYNFRGYISLSSLIHLETRYVKTIVENIISSAPKDDADPNQYARQFRRPSGFGTIGFLSFGSTPKNKISDEDQEAMDFFSFAISSRVESTENIIKVVKLYNKKYPGLLNLYKAHQMFLDIWKVPVENRERHYDIWLEAARQVDSTLYTHFIDKLEELKPMAINPDNDYKNDTYFELITRLKKVLRSLQYGYNLTNLWDILIFEEAKKLTGSRKELVQIKKFYQYKFEFENKNEDTKNGIDINSLIYAIERTS